MEEVRDMDRDHIAKLRLDRRLSSRRGWTPSDEIEEELAKLPDVSHKIAPEEDTEAVGSRPPESEPSGDR